MSILKHSKTSLFFVIKHDQNCWAGFRQKSTRNIGSIRDVYGVSRPFWKTPKWVGPSQPPISDQVISISAPLWMPTNMLGSHLPKDVLWKAMKRGTSGNKHVNLLLQGWLWWRWWHWWHCPISLRMLRWRLPSPYLEGLNFKEPNRWWAFRAETWYLCLT